MTDRLEARVARAIEEWLVDGQMMIVPREADADMVMRGALAMSAKTQHAEPQTAVIFGQPKDVWHAMLGVAPTPDTQDLAAAVTKTITDVYE